MVANKDAATVRILKDRCIQESDLLLYPKQLPRGDTTNNRIKTAGLLENWNLSMIGLPLKNNILTKERI